MTDLVFLSDIQLLQHQAALMGDKLIGMEANYKSSKQDFCFYIEYVIKSFQELLLICHLTIMWTSIWASTKPIQMQWLDPQDLYRDTTQVKSWCYEIEVSWQQKEYVMHDEN